MNKHTALQEYTRYVSLNVAAMLGLSLYILADTFFVAQGVGSDGLAALNLAVPLYNIMHGTGLMLGMGGATKFTLLASQGKHRDANRMFTAAVQATVCAAVFFFLLGALGAPGLTRLLGGEGHVGQLTCTYLRVLLMFSPVFLFNDLMICFVRNDGAPRRAMAATLTGCLMNILLDYVFVPALLYLMTANWCVELFPATPRWMWVIVFVGINTLINVRGITYTARADWIMFYVEAVVLALFIGFGLNYVLGEGGGTGQLVMDPLYRPGEMNLQFIGLACTIACLSFLGFDGISTLAEETHRPEVTIGRATMAALLCIGFLFMLQTYVATIIQPDMSKMNPDTAFFDAAELAAGDWFRKVLLVVNILAVGIANTMNAQAATSRVLYGMSRDNVLPGVSGLFRKVHPRFQTPYIATIAVGIFSILVAELSTVEDLARLVNFGALTSFILLNLAVYNFFWRREKMRGGKALLNYVICPFCGVLILGYVWLSFDSMTRIVGFSWLAIGLVIGYVKSKGYKVVPEAFRKSDMV